MCQPYHPDNGNQKDYSSSESINDGKVDESKEEVGPSYDDRYNNGLIEADHGEES